MPNQAAAPSEADALRPLAQAILHARILAALKHLLLALLAAVPVANRTRLARHLAASDWYPSPDSEATDHPDSLWDRRALRRMRRKAAWFGWILRCDRAEGMALSGRRAPIPCPALAARAPPWPRPRPNHPKSVAKTPRPAAMTHAQHPGSA